MNTTASKDNNGFVLLFAVSLAALLLAIALGISNIASNEIRFGTSAESTAGAFFAADTGVECAVFHDKSSQTVFPAEGQETSISCNNLTIPINYTATATGGLYDFILTGLGSDGNACAKVTVDKDVVSVPTLTKTTVVSRGYNVGDSNCASTSTGRVERELLVSYTVDNPTPPELGTGFPTVVGTNQGGSQMITNHVVNLPTTVNQGDLLLVFFSRDGGSTATWPSGWTQMFTETYLAGLQYNRNFEGRYKIANAADAGTNRTITVTTGSPQTTAYQSFSIIGYTHTPRASVAKGINSNPNPPSLSSGTGIPTKALWLAVVGRGAGNTNSPPASYAAYLSHLVGQGFDSSRVESARRELGADSEDPGIWSTDATADPWISATIGIEGEPI